MKEVEHLTKNQITGYRAGAFDAQEKREIGRHLLKCEICRKSLPAPTFEDFWNAVMSEREPEQTSPSEESELTRRFDFSFFPKIFGPSNAIAWSGAALIVLISFSLLLWLNAGRQWNGEREVAQAFNSNANEVNPAQIDSDERVFAPPTQNSEVDKPLHSSDSNRPANQKSLQQSAPQKKLNLSLRENVSRNSAKQISEEQRDNISSTRGGDLPANCSGETTVETEIGVSGEAVTLKWKKIPNAVRYHLYVSDNEEILIDEYETERETSYTVKKSLDAAKTYNWKVVVTTENGKTIVGDSQKFTIKNLQLNRSKFEKKKQQQIRCSQNN
jgi:hypothetical protein